MMDGSFVKTLADQVGLGHAIVKNNGKELVVLRGADGGWKVHETEQPTPQPREIDVSTLTGLVTYIDKNPDCHNLAGGCLLLIESPISVRLVTSDKDDAFRRRAYLVHAEAEPPQITLGNYVSVESLLIALQSSFMQTPDTAGVLAVLSSMKDEKVREAVDNGLAQTVTARVGVALVTDRTVPRVPLLAPVRTFNEVDQPASRFVLRLKSGDATAPVTAALFEADGGAWKSAAMANIRAYLEAELAKLPEANRPRVIARGSRWPTPVPSATAHPHVGASRFTAAQTDRGRCCAGGTGVPNGTSSEAHSLWPWAVAGRTGMQKAPPPTSLSANPVTWLASVRSWQGVDPTV